MADDVTAVFDEPVDRVPDVDDVVRATMAWHFSPETGSPYWTGRAAGLPFDPLVDVRTFADLRLFDDVAIDWAAVPADQLLPRGCRDGNVGVFESSGTTGAPKRVVDVSSRRRFVEFQSMLLDEVGFPREDGNWLHVGPTGPHVMGRNVTTLASTRGQLVYHVDLDPRWVRRCVREGREDLFRMYVDHLADQVRDVLSTQDIRSMSCTPPILEHLVSRPDVYALMARKVRGIIWGGTSMSPETLRLLQEEVLAGTTIQGAYGNTMMGVAPQRPPRAGDPAPCVFRPFYPYSVVEVVDPDDLTTPVAEDTVGRVKITTLTRDLFVPPMLERDLACRRRPVDGRPGVELSGVTSPVAKGGPIAAEGVY